jgi:tellurite methyltransferase
MEYQENYYDDKYSSKDFYWGLRPSKTCFKILELKPPDKPLKLLDIGSGEGRNAIFFARNGYQVTAIDLVQAGIDKTKQLADQIGVEINAFKANILDFRLAEEYDVIFSTGSLHYIPAELREEIFGNYKEFTAPDGVHMLSVFIEKPFIPPAPEGEKNSHKWLSGELFTLYHDWAIDYCTEEIFDCNSSGIPHQHATNRILARKVNI